MVLDWYNVSIQRVFKFCLEKLEKRYEEMNYKKRRDEVLSKMEKNSVLVLYSGVRHHVSADEYAPFEAPVCQAHDKKFITFFAVFRAAS